MEILRKMLQKEQERLQVLELQEFESGEESMMSIQRLVVESLLSSIFNIALHSLGFTLAFLYTGLTPEL